MYQLVVTIRETSNGREARAALSELLPGGGVAPLAARGPVIVSTEEMWYGDPLQALLDGLRAFAESELENGRTIHS